MALCLPCLPFVRLQLCSGVPGMMSWRESMNIETKRNKLLRMKPEQFQEARKLIQKTCANYNSGNCLLLDDGEPCRCPQLGAYSVICRYFRDAVLPGDMRLYYSVIGQKPKCYCILCGSPVYSSSNRAKYCPSCAKKERRRKETLRVRNTRARNVRI